MLPQIISSRGPMPLTLVLEHSPKCINCRYWARPDNKYIKQGRCSYFTTLFANIKNRPETAFIESYDDEAIFRTKPDFYCAAFKQLDNEIHDSNKSKAA